MNKSSIIEQSIEQSISQQKSQLPVSKYTSLKQQHYLTYHKRYPIQFQYFHQKFNQIHKPISTIISDNYYYQLIEKVHSQINQGKLQISPQKKQFKINNKKDQQINEEAHQEKLNQLQIQRKQTLQKLRDLQKQHLQLKVNYINTFSHKRKLSLNKSKEIDKYATLQQQDKNLNKILQAKRLFQKQIANKNKQISLWYYEKALQNQKNQQQDLKRKRQYRRSIVQQHMKSMELRHQSQKKLKNESIIQNKKIKSKKYIHQVFIQKQKIAKLQQQKNKQKQLQKIKQRSKLNINDIKGHQKQYNQYLQQYKQKNKSKIYVKNQKMHFNQNFFNQLIKIQLQQMKQKQQIKINKAQQIKQKIAIYQNYLDSQVRPKLIKSKKPFIIKQNRSAQPMTKQQIRQRGLKNLQIAKLLKADPQQITLKNKSQSVKLIPNQQTGSSYIDYLKQFKKPNREDQNQKQFRNLVKERSSVSDFQTASKALNLAETLAAKVKGFDDQKIYYSAKNKLDLLNKMM